MQEEGGCSCCCYRVLPNWPLNIYDVWQKSLLKQIFLQFMSSVKLVIYLHTVDPVTNSPLWSMRYLVQAPLPRKNLFYLSHVKWISGKFRLSINSLFGHKVMWGWVEYINGWNSDISLFPSILSYDRDLFYHPLIIKNNARKLGWHILHFKF